MNGTKRLARLFALGGVLALMGTAGVQAQNSGGPAGKGAAAPPRGGAPAYPDRPAGDPVVVARGQGLYSTNCSFCHGSDARGGEGGPSLMLSEVVLDDKSGELITPIVQGARVDKGMPKFDFTAQQISDIAAYIHSFPVTPRPTGAGITILGGDAKAGEAYFQMKCVSCHSVTGDLKGVATKFADPKALQQEIVMPGGKRGGFGTQLVPVEQLKIPPTMATVTLPSGEKVNGQLKSIDDFEITISLADGSRRSFVREGDVPKVEIHDPLAGHKQLLRVYSDNDIHNLTAYLVTLK